MKGSFRGVSQSKHKESQGFTIVELLIVVVVIAILAVIAIVAYTGITVQAKESALKSDLRNAATQLNVHRISDGGDFPSIKPDYLGNNLSYLGSAKAFCVFGEVNNRSFYADGGGSVREGSCPPPVDMQAMTPGYCAAMPVYTGSNPEAVLSLTDSRGGTTRTYEVARLADGKCWMLSNLKLGSVSDTITLTASDSNVASSFTLPQLTISGAQEPDLPRAYGPVNGDTGSGATNYGYLYNWSAATAGATTMTNPAGSAASYSICPIGWRLPRSLGSGSENEFVWLNAKMNNPNATSGSSSTTAGFRENWSYNGQFRGVLAGSFNNTFNNQGTLGAVWSSRIHGTTPGYAYAASLNITGGNPISAPAIGGGHAVRCLLN